MKEPWQPAAILWAYMAAAILLGDAVVWTAYTASPAVLPALIGLTILATLSASRPEVGVGLILVAVTTGRLGVLTDQVAVLALGGALGLAVVTLARARGVRFSGSPLPPLTLPVAAYVCATLIAAVEANDAVAARQMVRATLTGVALFVITSVSVHQRRNVVPLIVAAGLAAAAVGGRAILEYRSGAGADVGFATSTGTVVGRATAGFPQPNQLGGFLVLMIPLTIGGAALFPRLRPALAVAALIAAAGVYASFSRAGLLALLTIPLVFLRRRAILLVPVAAVALALLGPELLAERFATLTTSGSELATRQDYWRAAVTLWSDHPLTGIGLGGYPGGYAALPTPGRQFLPTTVLQPPPHAHNVFLNALAEEGVVGLGALVALFGTALVAAWRLAREHDPVRRTVGTTAVATLIAFIVHNIADVTLFETETALFLWVVLGLISGFSQPDRSPPS